MHATDLLYLRKICADRDFHNCFENITIVRLYMMSRVPFGLHCLLTQSALTVLTSMNLTQIFTINVSWWSLSASQVLHPCSGLHVTKANGLVVRSSRPRARCADIYESDKKIDPGFMLVSPFWRFMPLVLWRPPQVELADTFPLRAPADRREKNDWIQSQPVPVLADQNELRDHLF